MAPAWVRACSESGVVGVRVAQHYRLDVARRLAAGGQRPLEQAPVLGGPGVDHGQLPAVLDQVEVGDPAAGLQMDQIFDERGLLQIWSLPCECKS